MIWMSYFGKGYIEPEDNRTLEEKGREFAWLIIVAIIGLSFLINFERWV